MADDETGKEPLPNVEQILKDLQKKVGRKLVLSAAVLERLKGAGTLAGHSCPSQDICILCDSNDLCSTCDAMDWCVSSDTHISGHER